MSRVIQKYFYLMLMWLGCQPIDKSPSYIGELAYNGPTNTPFFTKKKKKEDSHRSQEHVTFVLSDLNFHAERLRESPKEQNQYKSYGCSIY